MIGVNSLRLKSLHIFKILLDLYLPLSLVDSLGVTRFVLLLEVTVGLKGGGGGGGIGIVLFWMGDDVLEIAGTGEESWKNKSWLFFEI